MGITITDLSKRNNMQTFIAWGIYFLINIIFCIKYNPVSEIKPLFIIILYPSVVYGLYKLTSYKGLCNKNYFFIGIAGITIIFAAFLLSYIDKYSVEVDRWSALSFWSENLMNGLYPYDAPTHLGHRASPYPVWQFFHLPFYLLGDTGYAQLFCLAIFFIFLFIIRNKINVGSFILLLVLSPGFWWEVSVRSDLLYNMLLVFIFISSLFYYQNWWKNKSYLIALITGLFLCTKMLVGIPLFIYIFPYFLSLKIRQKLWFTIIVIAGAVIPFLPFLIGESSILNHPEYNPMLQQTYQANIIVVIVLFVLILLASLKWKTMKDCFFYSGLFLFLLIFSVGTEIMIANDLHYTIFGDQFDISYLNVSIPFFLFCINEKYSFQHPFRKGHSINASDSKNFIA